MGDKRRTIAFALDGTEASRFALSWGLGNIVQPASDHIVLLSAGVIEDDLGDLFDHSLDQLASNGRPDERPSRSEKRASQAANTAVGAAEQLLLSHYAGSGVDISYELISLKTEDPRDTIANFVDQMDVDLVVVGSKGAVSLQKLWTGSTGEYLVQTLKCPVLVVKDKKKA
ncbi:uncharacterized protein BJ171DRAFT_502887 [Polychytrium aggregatum]|uniref:uncharacterized protein n=1 Tax=Polychytrium aggregatum TaxID=110093 RepID=UPI0022FDFA4F|nr:uncharacterized protein BJ171DRAFT_502887 [Polychytrium aggregatum]KAI9205065.1 hypothetical protein BJ171DRAFT_502887 [Polychytrium aggregatum]